MSANSAIFNPTESTSAATGDGFSCPRLTTTGRLAITFGPNDKGMMVYDTTLNNLFIWNGTAWESVPASGDAGANGSVQYNDNGVVSGAPNFIYDKATSAVSITGDLTVRTNKLVVNATGVGAGKTPSYPLDVAGNVSMTGAGTGTRFLALLDETNTYAGSLTIQAGGGSAGFGGGIVLYGHSHATYPGAVWIGRSATSSGPIMFGDYGTGPGNKFLQLDTGGVCTWYDGAGGTRMTLNSTGLGVGTSPTGKLTIGTGAYVAGTLSGTSSLYSTVGQGLVVLADGLVVGTRTGSDRFILDTSGNVGISVVPSAWNSSAKAFEIGTAGNSVFSSAATFVEMTNNAYLDSVSNWVRVNTGNAAARFRTSGSGFLWLQAAAGANPITWTTTMQLDSNGNLILQSSATPATLTTNGQLTVNATSNTNVRFSYRGTDGVTRTADLTLA